jgi:very-short-patch-repair endonuclease
LRCDREPVDLERWLSGRHGVVRRAELLDNGVTDAEIKRRVRSGDWRRPFRGVVVTHAAADDEHRVRCRAALVAAGEGAYLSCIGAAINFGLRVPAGSPVHVSVPERRAVAHEHGLRAHRNAVETAPTEYGGLPSVCIEAALIGAFGCLSDLRERRAFVIDSVRDRLVSVDRVAAALSPRMRRRGELFELLAICNGSESEAEIAMLLLLRSRRVPEPARQDRVATRSRRYRLDLAYPDALLAIEVDGKAWHFNAERRTADITRDADLAASGWLTLRFTYEQISNEPTWVAGCVAAALAARTKIT